MFEFHATTHIRATPDRVWSILADVASWPSWNPTVDRVTGRAALGEKLTVFAKVANGKGFPVKVAALDAPRSMVWTGGAPLRFVFKGERTFTITPEGDGVRFTMREVFTGLFASLIRKSMPDLQPTFDETVKALKAKAEASA